MVAELGWSHKDLRSPTVGSRVPVRRPGVGLAVTILTSDGAISVDRGCYATVRRRHQGRRDLDNDEFIEGSDVLLGDHGSHAQWHRTQDEYCAIVNDLLQ